MGQNAQRILSEAMELSLEERASIAEQLIQSLDGPPDENVEAAWQKEVERRIKEIDNGEVELLDWEEVRAKLRDRFGAPR
jgi:putative addiction module component (TIGR02574 family)